nr:retrovirus-related Pol polyprotein from transposon TNT 1-94 [Tanacetum cinerariifolium]
MNCMLHAKRIAMNANPLAFVATAQSNQDPYYQTPKSHKPYAPTSKASIPSGSHATTKNRGKDIAKPITPPSESASEEDSDPKQAQRDKDMQKNLALIAKYFKKIYKPTNNNFRTSQTLETRMWISLQELEAHYSFMEKIQEVVSLESNSNAERLEQVQYNDEYNVFANVNQHCEQSESTSNTCLVEKDDSDVTPDSPNMCEHDIQTDQNVEDERAALANLIANLKLDCKSILTKTSKTLEESNSVRDTCLVALQTKQTEFEKYKACNDRIVDYDELEFVKEKHNELVKQSLLTKSYYEGLVKEKIKIVQLILFIADSGCTKHMTGNLSLFCNFVEKYLGTVHFGNDQCAPILGYGDLVQGNITMNRVYYVEGLNHNLFSIGQFCDADLEVAFRKSTCFVRDIQGNDLVIGNRGSDLYTISLQESNTSTPICLMAKASPTQAWLWHQTLSHLTFEYINLLSKKDVVIGLPELKYVKDQLFSSCEASDYDNYDPVPQIQNVLPLADTTVPSQIELDLLFGPLYDEFFNGEAEYVALSTSYAQVMWMRTQLKDYGFNYNKIPLY